MPALEGLRILDLSQWEAGPSCTQALAWLGAEVVKIEPPGRGEPGRAIGGDGFNSPYFVFWNSNKRSAAIDLDTEQGRALLLRMLPRFDVLVENFGPGVVEKLRLDYAALQPIHPTLIYASVKGFGTSGPYADYKCMDMVAQAAGGVLSATGEPDGPPTRPGVTLGDSGTGMQLALAITAAYVQKLRTGEGQRIELSMQEAVTYYMRTTIANSSDWGRRAAPRTGNGIGAMLNLYPCKPGGANDYVYMMVVNTRMWQSLCRAMQRDDLLTDPRFDRGAARHENHAALYEEIAKWTREQTKHEAMAILGKAGVPCSAVLDTRDLFENPHLQARGFVKHVEHPVLGEIPLLGWPARLSKSRVEIEPAPLLGEHTAEVLRGELGLDEETIAGLGVSGVIGTSS
jgi:crotonobetainyl-CoA:carnitine CoA-transferase CaiB-like acyl-CoA transferase